MARNARSGSRLDTVLFAVCGAFSLVFAGVLPGNLREAFAAGLRRTVVAPLVSLDLRPISGELPDSRPLITTEPPTYALHHWDGQRVATHYEKVCDWDVIAYYGPHLQPMIREMERERVG